MYVCYLYARTTTAAAAVYVFGEISSTLPYFLAANTTTTTFDSFLSINRISLVQQEP